jgi:hypothetical protein
MLEMFGDSEISKSHFPIGGQENILCLEISMDYLSIVYMLDRKTHLSEPSEKLVLRNDRITLFGLLNALR